MASGEVDADVRLEGWVLNLCLEDALAVGHKQTFKCTNIVAMSIFNANCYKDRTFHDLRLSFFYSERFFTFVCIRL